MKQVRLAYIMSRFPRLSETFILREMTELKKLGWDLSIYPLIYEKQDVLHAETINLLSDVINVPFLSINILKENIKVILQNPFLYFSIFFEVIFRNITSPKFISRAIILFPKSVYLAGIMSAEGIGHIHAHFASHPALMAWIIHRLKGIPYSFTAHAHDLFVDYSMLGSKVNDAVFVVTISDFNANFICNKIGEWARDKIHVIHCGIRPEDYCVNIDKNRHSLFTIINIGSLEPYKGQQVLIDACAILRDRGLHFSCIIIGGGELEKGLQEQIHDLKLETYVKLIGPQPQEFVAQILPTADCYVQPSVITKNGKMEGIPVAIMEAYACNLPVIASNISGISELVKPGLTGIMVEPGDPLLLANAIENIYQNHNYGDQLGNEGRRLVEKEFSIYVNTMELSNLFSTFNQEYHVISTQQIIDKTVHCSPKMEE